VAAPHKVHDSGKTLCAKAGDAGMGMILRGFPWSWGGEIPGIYRWMVDLFHEKSCFCNLFHGKSWFIMGYFMENWGVPP